jgi:hypothetical protein
MFKKHYLTGWNKQNVLNSLPYPGDETEKGKTRSEIANETGIEAEEVGLYLQSLKRERKARCYGGRKWRRGSH